jgi:hypothetical protein
MIFWVCFLSNRGASTKSIFEVLCYESNGKSVDKKRKRENIAAKLFISIETDMLKYK